MLKSRSIISTLLNEPITFLGGLLFFLMLFSPSYNVIFKIALIVLLLLIIIFSRIAFNKININKSVLAWYIIFITHGIFFSFVGFIYKNNPGFILRSTTYNVIWPILYLIFMIGLYKKSSLAFLVRTVIISNLLISLYLIGSALTLFGILPALPVIKFDMSFLAVDELAGLVKIEAPSIVCLLFTLPFLICLMLIDGERTFGFSKLFIRVSLIISIIAVIATARRAVILNIFLGFICTVIFTRLAPAIDKKAFNKRILKILFWGIGFLIVFVIIAQESGLFNFTLVFNKFLSAFSSKQNVSDASTQTRYRQFDLLIKSWLHAPLLGHGHGAVSQYIIRSKTAPWMYELSYVALLFQTGIIGLGIYFALIIWPIYKGVRLIKTADKETCFFIIPSITACACFLIANATNPYLQSYDYIWALFFPVAIINYYLKEHTYKNFLFNQV